MATFRSPLIVGVFRDEATAKNVVNALNNAGFGKNQIGIALREGGMVTRTLQQDLINLGVPQDHASYYDNEYKAGHPIVSVRPDGREQEARNILTRYGAYDYATRAAAAETTAPRETEEQRVMKLREEQLRVEKQPAETGEVRLHKEVVTEQQQVDVPVTREEVVVERHPYREGQATEAPVGQEETIRVPTKEEQVHVTKETVETGEVTVSKRPVEEVERVSEPVEREEMRLEREGQPHIREREGQPPTRERKGLEREGQPPIRGRDDIEQP